MSHLWNALAVIAAARVVAIHAAANKDSLDDFTTSCYNARNMRDGSADFCWMVSWTSATLYNSRNFSVYGTGDPIAVTEQDLLARSFATDLVDMSSDRVSIECKNAVRRFACVSVFPYCPAVSQSFSSSSFLPPCNMQCEQVNQACTTSLYAHVPHPVTIDCSAYKSNRNCLLNVPVDRFLLDPEQGPFDGIAALYIAMLVVWVLASALWAFLLYVVYPDTVLPVSKAMCAVPLLRALTAVFSVIFWLDCIENGGLCQNIRAAALLLFLPFVESVQMFLFLALAKGWNTTRAYLPPDTWRAHTLLSFAFFVCLTAFSRTLSPASVNWVIYSAALYGAMYCIILRSALREMAVLSAQVQCLTERMAPLAVEPLREKHVLFQRFLVLVLCELLLEGTCRYLLAAGTLPFIALLLVYELGSAAFLLLIGWSYRSRQYSPFYFMMPTSLEYSALAGREEGGEAQERERLHLQEADDEQGGGSWWAFDRGGGGGATGRRRERAIMTHSREREDDVAAIERVRLARAQRPSPFVEVFVSRMSGTHSAQTRQPLLTSEAERTGRGGIVAAPSLSSSRNGNSSSNSNSDGRGIERHRSPQQEVGPREHPVEGAVEMTAMRSVGEEPAPAPGLGPAPAPAVSLLADSSIDLSRLLASVGAPLARHPHSTRTSTSTSTIPGGAEAASDGAARGSRGTPARAAEGLQLQDLGLGGDWATQLQHQHQHQHQHHPDATPRENQLAPAPAPPQHSLAHWGGWIARSSTVAAATTHRPPAPGARMIAVTALDCQEVMLAISKPDV